jgi:hypothetical protein
MIMPETCWDTNKYIIFSASGWLFIHRSYEIWCIYEGCSIIYLPE